MRISDWSSGVCSSDLAQGAGAKIIGLANAGGDPINAIKQASVVGVVAGGQNLAGLLVFLTDVHSLVLEIAQGLIMTEAFYWDLNDQTREWSARFAERNGGTYPTMDHAGVYTSVLHYTKDVEALDGDDGGTATATRKEPPTTYPFVAQASARR